MSKIKYIISILCLVMSIVACQSDEKDGIPATEISDIRFLSAEGQILLYWDYVGEENTNRYVEIRYYDPVKQKQILKTVSGLVTSITIENINSQNGEYQFLLQPFSTTFTPGNVQTVLWSDDTVIPDPNPDPEPEPEPDPNPVVVSSSKLEITVNDIYISRKEGDRSDSGFSTDMKYLLDGNPQTQVTPWKSAQPEDIFSIYVTYPKVQRFLKFSYQNSPWGSICYVISELECYVRAEETDDWTLMATLTVKDGLSQEIKGAMSNPKELLAPFEFKYIKLRASKTAKVGSNLTAPIDFNTGFAMAEFAVYDVVYTIKD